MNKPSLTLSINPTYFCNFDCSFCYLTKDQLNDKKILDIEKIKSRVKEISTFFSIDCVDLYGGEVGLLDSNYLQEIRDCFSNEVDFNIITNLSVINSFFSQENIEISVSWEGEIRRQSTRVFENITKLGKPIHLLMLASKEMMDWSDDELKKIIEKINANPFIHSVEIKPYSQNQANQFNLSYQDFESHIKRWFDYSHRFSFVNELNLKASLSGNKNSFSDDHLYLTPSGDFAVLDFDDKNNEFFLKVDSIDNYLKWANSEKVKVNSSSVCTTCEFLGSCMTEHIRHVESKDASCDGMFHLLKWYENEKL